MAFSFVPEFLFFDALPSFQSFADFPKPANQLCLRQHFISTAGADNLRAVTRDRAAPATALGAAFRIKFKTAKITASHAILNNFRIRWSNPPTARANGNTKPVIARAVFQPRSFTVTDNWAMQGTKSVIVTVATRT